MHRLIKFNKLVSAYELPISQFSYCKRTSRLFHYVFQPFLSICDGIEIVSDKFGKQEVIFLIAEK